MSAQRVDAAARTADITKQQLQHRRSSYDLRAKRMLRPPDGVDDRAGLLHVAVFANRSVEVGGLEKLLFGNSRDALDHFGRISRVMFLQKLKHAIRILQS